MGLHAVVKIVNQVVLVVVKTGRRITLQKSVHVGQLGLHKTVHVIEMRSIYVSKYWKEMLAQIFVRGLNHLQIKQTLIDLQVIIIGNSLRVIRAWIMNCVVVDEPTF